MTTVAQFTISFVQYLNEKGEANDPLPAFAAEATTLKKLYQIMVQTRLFDKKAVALQRTGRLGTYAPIYGQEAISTAIGHVMRRDDLLVPYYRDYAGQFQRGVKMSEVLAFWGGDERGNQFECDSEDLPFCVPIASQCLHAAGVAFAFKYRNEKRVAVVSLGDGGCSEGDFYEAMNVSGAWNLPLVIIVNNNQWAISVPISKQTAAKTIAQKAIAAGFDGIQVDGNDVIACCQVIGDAIEKARTGGGPTLIEAITYRLCDHTTADDATRYQPKEDVELAKLKEPISRLKHYLESQNLWNDEQEKQLMDECTKIVEDEVNEYLTCSPQPVTSLFDYLYEQLPENLVEQRAIAMEEASHV